MFSRRRPPRIAHFDYLGLYAYFVTICVDARAPVFTSDERTSMVLAPLLDIAARDRFTVVAYCFMPDHLHVLVQGDSDDADLRRYIHAFKQHSGFNYARAMGGRLWQRGFHDVVLRNDDAIQSVAAYVVANPVRAGLCEKVTDYPYSGSAVYELPVLAESIQWRPRGSYRSRSAHP